MIVKYVNNLVDIYVCFFMALPPEPAISRYNAL
jgi:hypothetical protein